MLNWRAVAVNIHEISSSETFLFCLNVVEASYGKLNLYGKLKKVNFCYLVSWTQLLQAEIQLSK